MRNHANTSLCFFACRITKLEKESSRNWDKFYTRNTTNFFKDRHYLQREFHEVFETGEGEQSTAGQRENKVDETDSRAVETASSTEEAKDSEETEKKGGEQVQAERAQDKTLTERAPTAVDTPPIAGSERPGMVTTFNGG